MKRPATKAPKKAPSPDYFAALKPRDRNPMPKIKRGPPASVGMIGMPAPLAPSERRELHEIVPNASPRFDMAVRLALAIHRSQIRDDDGEPASRRRLADLEEKGRAFLGALRALTLNDRVLIGQRSTWRFFALDSREADPLARMAAVPLPALLDDACAAKADLDKLQGRAPDYANQGLASHAFAALWMETGKRPTLTRAKSRSGTDGQFARLLKWLIATSAKRAGQPITPRRDVMQLMKRAKANTAELHGPPADLIATIDYFVGRS